MTPLDHPQFVTAVLQLCDALRARAPNQAGMAVWIQTVKEFPLADLIAQFDIWAKSVSVMPKPADLYKACNRVRAEREERIAKAERRDAIVESDRMFSRSGPVGDALREFSTELREQAPIDPKEWALVLRERFVADRTNPNGSAMCQAQIVCACAALRVPLSDVYAEREQRRQERAA